MTDYFSEDTYHEALQYLRKLLPETHSHPQVGLVLGSGLGLLQTSLQESIEVPYSQIPHFPTSSVPGHASKLVFGSISGRLVCCMVGRKHVYEGASVVKTVFPIRVLKMLGCSIIILTNASGGLNPEFKVGDIAIINDHVSFAGK